MSFNTRIAQISRSVKGLSLKTTPYSVRYATRCLQYLLRVKAAHQQMNCLNCDQSRKLEALISFFVQYTITFEVVITQ